MKIAFILAFVLLLPITTSALDSYSGDVALQKRLDLQSFNFEPDQVVMDGSPKSINFLASIHAEEGLKKDKSYGYVTHATFLGPHPLWNPFFRDNKTVEFLPPPVFGDEKNGTYRGTMSLPLGVEEGAWQLDSVQLVDSKGFVRDLQGEDLRTLPHILAVEVGIGRWLVLLVLYPAIFFFILFVIYRLRPIAMIWQGYDGATSTSKLQFFLWTLAALYAYMVIALDAYFNHCSLQLSPTIPENLLLAMGLSATTALAAKGITSSYAERGLVTKSLTAKGGVFFDDLGYPDLAKIQLMAWTSVAILVFLAKVFSGVIESTVQSTSLPDIDTTLMVLMGIGQGSYIGKKLVTKDDKDAPRLDDINPKKGKADDPITITGINFGDEASKCSITIDGKKAEIQAITWTKGEVRFQLNKITNKESILPKMGEIRIGVIAGNKSSVNDLDFEIIEGESPTPSAE